jgi:hypothetical protein
LTPDEGIRKENLISTLSAKLWQEEKESGNMDSRALQAFKTRFAKTMTDMTYITEHRDETTALLTECIAHALEQLSHKGLDLRTEAPPLTLSTNAQ